MLNDGGFKMQIDEFILITYKEGNTIARTCLMPVKLKNSENEVNGKVIGCPVVLDSIDALHKHIGGYNNDKTTKPPLGVKPCYIQAEERIKDLADAISRYANRGDYEIIKKWANEICLQCEIAGMEK